MNRLSSPYLRGYFTKFYHNIYRNKSYKPVKLASKIILPNSGVDESLHPIVYVHGLTAAKELWQDIPQRLSNATKRKSYIYDLRNHGDSDWSNEFTHEINLEDLRYFMDSQNIKKAVIVGHSMGAWYVCMFALKWPERVEMLINEDMTINDEFIRATSVHVLSYVKLWEEAVKSIPVTMTVSEGIIHAFDYLYSRFPTRKGMDEKEHLHKCNFPIKLTPNGYDVKTNMPVVCKYLENMIVYGTKGLMNGIYDGPAYFMMGSLSNFRESLQLDIVMKHYPNVDIEVMEGVTHNIHLRSPEIFTERFLSFYKTYFNTISEQSIKLSFMPI